MHELKHILSTIPYNLSINIALYVFVCVSKWNASKSFYNFSTNQSTFVTFNNTKTATYAQTLDLTLVYCLSKFPSFCNKMYSDIWL